ncbi:hypothetical protein [Gandjariella thermophila]|uniref:Peptide zinc metalloprotease protein n=1 Tax=Gandjariella thermophila TaxID=1931992 RepID=A0A4D4J5P8_9PSEU|nr:hypothetical protein [Gandjariella thermophila]GDY29826.1 hypothetical protein GTS_14590 [Gandjariella thermophila]
MQTGSPFTATAAVTAAPESPGALVPRVAEGVEALGEYQGSGYQEGRYLVYRADQQAVLLSPLLYLLLTQVDGHRDIATIAQRLSTAYDQPLDADGVRYLIEEKLEPLGLVLLRQPPTTPPRADPLLALTLRGVLLPTRAVQRIARLFAPLHLPPVVAAFIAAFVAMDGWMFGTGHADAAMRETVAEPGQTLAFILLMLATIVFHEFGHASGCHYGGARPGAIGVGLYLAFPCFYTNVTDAYRLNRGGRLRTDLGGVYFNAVFVVALGCCYLAVGYPPLLAAAMVGNFLILQQLSPSLRLDGYYIMGDLVGVPNLFGQVRPILRSLLPRKLRRDSHPVSINLRPRVRWMVTAWVVTVVPFLMGSLILMLIRLPAYTSSVWHGSIRHWTAAVHAYQHHQILGAVLAGFSTLLLWLPWIGMATIAVRTLRRLYRALVRLVDRRRTKIGATAGVTVA